MATIATSSSSKRNTNHDLPLVPFIDFMLCLVSFLLITAVWSQSARLEATAQVPTPSEIPREPEKRLHVQVKDSKFQLTWKQGDTVVSSSELQKKPVMVEGGVVTYPDLEDRIRTEWKSLGAHRDARDQKIDSAVLHAQNNAEFEELAAVMDAVRGTKRTLRIGKAQREIAAFGVSLATN